MGLNILVSAGETSGDLYAADLVEALRRHEPDARFFGCAGPRLREAGVEAVVDAASLAVVGLVEVISHIPRIYSEFRKLRRAAAERVPDVAILTDSPDFHLRLAPDLKRLGVPVVYFVAPQAWAWRRGRVHTLKRNVKRLLCIFPFEEEFFRAAGVPATYIGHPLARRVHPSIGKEEFCGRHGIPLGRPIVALLPGSRPGEVARHLPAVIGAAERILARRKVAFVLATPEGLSIPPVPGITVVAGATWDAISAADVALAASGTVTVEAALLGTPMVVFYRVATASWWLGRPLVKVPFYSMVNLVAGRRVVPELIQSEMTPERMAGEVLALLEDPAARERMREDLGEIGRRLRSSHDPIEQAADEVLKVVQRK